MDTVTNTSAEKQFDVSKAIDDGSLEQTIFKAAEIILNRKDNYEYNITITSSAGTYVYQNILR
jgi:sarcosine oxidase gamma subunit